jgi:hypothetical protein
MIPITTETRDKIHTILDMGISFIERNETTYKDNPDVMFIFNSFMMKFEEYYHQFRIRNEYDVAKYSDEISNFESALFAWTQTLSHTIPGDNLSSNSFYSVLYGVLVGIETLLEEAMIEYQDSDEYEEDIEEDDRQYLQSIVEDEEFDEDEEPLEQDFERSFPD